MTSHNNRLSLLSIDGTLPRVPIPLRGRTPRVGLRASKAYLPPCLDGRWI